MLVFKHPKYYQEMRKRAKESQKAQADKLASEQAGGRVGPKATSSQAGTGGRVGPQVTSLQAKKNVDRQQAT